jgi:DnaK suppressor protein
VEEALRRLDAGQYGICDTCQRLIGIERLKARLTATLCFDCKERAEHDEARYGE